MTSEPTVHRIDDDDPPDVVLGKYLTAVVDAMARSWEKAAQSMQNAGGAADGE